MAEDPQYNNSRARYGSMDEVLRGMKNEEEEQEEEPTHNPKLDTFAYLQRQVSNGNALQGTGGIILKNGTYSVSKFVHNIDPVYTVVPVIWIPKNDEQEAGQLLIENDAWNGSVPIMHATRSNVRFYGCYLDPDDHDSPKLECNDGGMFDFNYTTKYSDWIKKRSGGCRLERHKFAHIETPLDREGYSGVFILGKLIDEKRDGQKTGNQFLCLTAYIIARGQTLFVPPNTIHTNDYQRGTWRTYLEVADIDICDLKRQTNNRSIELSFYCGLTKKRMRQYEIPVHDIKDNIYSKPPKVNHNRDNNSFSINQLGPVQVDEKDDDDGLICHCQCGTKMNFIQKKDCYKDEFSVICNLCDNEMMNKTIMVYHCPKGRNEAAHKDGYDLCQSCAATKVLSFQENKDSNYRHLASQIIADD